MGGIPAPLNYEGFPKSVCTSLNDEVCHGIPADDIILKDGDIINVDVSTIYNGYFSDSSRMFCIGNVSEDKKKLVEVAKECLDVGLKEVKPFTGDRRSRMRARISRRAMGRIHTSGRYRNDTRTRNVFYDRANG